jgi:ubiquinone/menaquinone biosynthesis C-methylase UbiE
MNNVKTAEAYNKFAKYYDAYVGDFKDDLNLYRSFCDKNDKILEVGCGTGRVIKYLLENGLNDITGVDISEKMLGITQIKLMKYLNSNNLSLKKHDLSMEPLKKNFNKVFITYYTLNYILENPAKFLRNAYLSMSNNSLIIIDLFFPMLFLDPASDNVWIEREIKSDENKTITLRSKKYFDGAFEHRTLVFVEDNNTTTVESRRKFYPKEEIEKLLAETGFGNIKAIYGYSLGDTSKFTDDYPLHGYNEFNVNLEEYANREEVKPNFVVYAYKLL